MKFCTYTVLEFLIPVNVFSIHYSFYVDDSGRWGRGGLFSGISTRSMQPETYYKKASKMRGTV